MSENNKTSSRFQATENSAGNTSGRFGGTNGTGTKKKVNYSGGYDKGENYFLLVIGFVFLLLPLIVHAVKYDPKLSEFDWFSMATKSIDVFLYWKQWAFVMVFFVMVACIIGSLVNGKRKFSFIPIFIPLAVYAAAALLSTLFSKYRSYGMEGIFEQFENVFCLLGYALIVYFVYTYVTREKDVRTLINVLAVGALIIGLIGTFQGLKLDLFRSSFGKSLIASSDVPASTLTFSFDLGRAYVTLYNPNYVGVYCTLIIPLFTVLVPFAKNIKERILYIAVVLTMLISMFAAQFKAGIVSLVIVGVIILVLLRKTIIKKWFITLPVVAAVVAMFFVVDTVNNHAYSSSIQAAFKVEKSAPKTLTEIETTDKGVKIVYNNEEYYFNVEADQAEDGTLSYRDYSLVKADGTAIELQLTEDNSKYIVNDANLQTFTIYPIIASAEGQQVTAVALNIEGKEWNFVKRGSEYKYCSLYGRETSIETAETAVFDGYEGLASKRGFIWARTLPLLKKYVLLGSGADTFSIVFPQHDYVGSYNNGYEGQLISKPHCWYLQVGVQTGVVSLIALLVFYMMYFVQCICLYSKRNFDSYLSQVGVAIFVGTIGYMIAGLTNDSSITVAPVFWGLMGLGIVVNTMVKRETITE